jgi:glycosyltransferase involved in cell wall biosynthesis
MAIHLLDNTYAWFGKHAGWALFPESLRLNGCANRVVKPRQGVAIRAIGKAYSTWRGSPQRDQTMAASELEFLLRLRVKRSAGHVLFLDEHLRYLPVPSDAAKWVGTIHLPRRCWKAPDLELLRALPGILVLSESMRAEFGDIFGHAQIKVILHGVDTGFFRPGGVDIAPSSNRLVYVGAWLRNTAMLARLIPELCKRFPGVIFDLVVPLFARNDTSLVNLRSHPAVRWHHDLSDETLRDLYQGATAMLMPMEDSGANNAIVEALASGLPIITTDTGGIRSYGGGTVFPVVKNNDDAACLELAAAYLTDREYRREIAQKARTFAETKLAWTVVAKEYVNVYTSLGLI